VRVLTRVSGTLRGQIPFLLECCNWSSLFGRGKAVGDGRGDSDGIALQQFGFLTPWKDLHDAR